MANDKNDSSFEIYSRLLTRLGRAIVSPEVAEVMLWWFVAFVINARGSLIFLTHTSEIGPVFALRRLFDDWPSRTIGQLTALLIPTVFRGITGAWPVRSLLRGRLSPSSPIVFRDDADRETDQAGAQSGEPHAHELVAKADTPLGLIQAAHKRSAQKAVRALSRANFVLGAGLVMAALGVGVFIFSAKEEPPGATIARSLVSSIPRISVLVFIEIIAGFFLRQYRVLMEEYRFFEGLERQREADHIALLANDGDKERLSSLVQSIREATWSGGVLKTGEASVTVEATKASTNETTEVLRIAGDAIGKIVETVSKLSK
jgi:hypothetical protein